MLSGVFLDLTETLPVRITYIRLSYQESTKGFRRRLSGGLGEGKKMSRNAKLDREKEQDGGQKQTAKSNRAKVSD